MNDAERWINLQGPPPEGIRALLEAAREAPPPPMTPELAAELDHLVAVGIAAEEAKWARARRVKLGVAAFALVAAAAVALGLVLRAAAPAVAAAKAADLAHEAAPSVLMLGSAAAQGTAAPVVPRR